MVRPRLAWLAVLALGVLLAFLVSAGSAQDDKKEDPKPPVRLRGQLPPNFRLLGLSDVQKQAIYKVQNDFDAKIAALEEQLKKVKIEEKQAIDKLLTVAQRARLKEILKEKSGIDSGPEKPPAGKP